MLQESEKRIRRDEAAETSVHTICMNGLEVEGGVMVNRPAACARVISLSANPSGVIAKEPRVGEDDVGHQGGSRSPPGMRESVSNACIE